MKICARKSSGAFWSDFDELSGNSCVLLEEPKDRLGHVLISKRLTVEVVALDSEIKYDILEFRVTLNSELSMDP